ncbi:hypothetical protein [Cesiribacter sp. SM1]|uniref:hypothetical protein n=1 Tax=Cesiribacter sp. SM1 TaxID=2861196 RepID=UPI001CD2C1BF|nr:hypothetical protein [Cesiribacter sp. SM1]
MRFNRKYLRGLYKYLRKRFSYFIADLKNRFIHQTVKDPHRLIWVNPADIRLRLLTGLQTDLNIFEKVKEDTLPLYDLSLGAFDPRRNTGRVIGGDWDQHVKPYAGEILYESYNQRFNEGAAWEETPYFKKGAEILRNGGVLYGCRSLDEFKNNRLAYIEGLYNDIKINGYNTQNKTASKDDRSKGIHHEISVNIGRNGEIIYNNATGNNRLALSKTLKLAKVPVLVVARHKQWELLKKRVKNDGLADDSLKSQLLNHPDF